MRSFRGLSGVLLGLLLAVGCSGQGAATSPETAPVKETTPAAAPAAAPAPAATEAAADQQAAKPAPGKTPAKAPAATPAKTPAATPAAQAAAQKPVPKDVVILKGNPMGGVKFLHTAHSKDRNIKCETCHHPSKTEKPGTAAQQACKDCHAKTAAAPMKTNYKAAFHNATASTGICIDCHKAENAKGKKAPAKCTDCHKKENV